MFILDLLIVFIILVISMLFCLIRNYSMCIALLIGLIGFIIISKKRGFSVKDIIKMSASGVKDALIVVEVLVLIGALTGLWRSSGTIAYFVYNGLKIITPNLFIIIAFLLTTVVSFAMGTCFGVTGTVGVILMAVARAGGVNPLAAAGAIISGVYFGDRCSPTSSAASLVAVITKTDLYENIKLMLKSVLIPYIVAFAVYTLLSFANPIKSVDAELSRALRTDFQMTIWCAAPAAIILIFALLKISVKKAITASIIVSALVTVFVQKMPFNDMLKTAFWGFTMNNSSLASILSGGGIFSMFETALIVLISSTYSGILNGTNLLENVENIIEKMSLILGRFVTTCIVSVLSVFIFCNQTIGSMIVNQLMFKTYQKQNASNSELMLDIENSVIVISGLVPWAIASSVPRSMLGVGWQSTPYMFLLYILPLCYGLSKNKLSKWYGF